MVCRMREEKRGGQTLLVQHGFLKQECEKSGVVAADSAKYLCCRGYAAAKHAHIKRLHVNRDVYTTKLNKERTRSIECQRNHCLEGGSLCNR